MHICICKKSDDQNVFVRGVKNWGQEFGHCTWHYDDENENERKDKWSDFKKINVVILLKVRFRLLIKDELAYMNYALKINRNV